MQTLALAAIVLLAVPAAASAQCQQELASPQPPSSKVFGADVAVDGDVGVALEVDPTVEGPGWIHFYARSGSGDWVLSQSEPWTLGPLQELALDAAGGRLAIGDSAWSMGRGRLVLFQRSAPGQLWTFHGILESPTPELGSAFGEALAWAGDQLIVGQPGASASPPVHVFELAPGGGPWAPVQTLTLQQGSRFGQSISLGAGELWIGAPFYYPLDPSFRPGAAVRFLRPGASGPWVQADLFEPTGVAQDNEGFGYTLDLDGDLLAVGSPFRDDQGLDDLGFVRCYRRSSLGVWFATSSLSPPSTNPNAQFGRSFAVDGDFIVLQGDGLALIYQYWLGTGTVILTSLIQPAQGTGSTYGASIDLDDGLAWIGDLAGAAGSANLGRVEALDVRDHNKDFLRDACQAIGEPFCGPAQPNSTGQPARIVALDTGAPLASIDLVVESMPAGQFGLILVSMDAGFVSKPGGSAGDLCIFGPTLTRYAASLFLVDATGIVNFTVDTTQIPQGVSTVAASVGQTWNFQSWMRDVGGQSNFSDAVAVTF